MTAPLSSLADHADERFTEAQRAKLAEFEAAPGLVEIVEPQWTNAELTQRRALIDHLKARIEEYEHGDWSVWDWGDEAEAIMRLLTVTRYR